MDIASQKKLGLFRVPLMVFVASTLTACATYRNVDNSPNQASLPDLTKNLSHSDRFSDDEPVSQWWSMLDDKSLSALIGRSLQVNHDLRIALASVNESRALLQRSKLDYAPSVTASLGAVREKQSAQVYGATTAISHYYETGFASSWELDLFGRIRNQVKLSNAQLNVREADLKAVQISLAAEVASVYLGLRGNQQLLDIAARSVDIQNQNLRLVEQLNKVGRTSSYDLSRAKSQLALTAARLPVFEQDYRLSLSRLSVLTVTSVEDLETQLNHHQQFPLVPPSVAVGNLSDLLKRRPDVVRAERALEGATAEYNLNVAQLYPSINFVGTFGFLSSRWSQLGSEESESFRFTPSIQWAGLDLTRVKSHIKAADAKAQGRLAAFEKTILIALQETQDAFTRFANEEQRMQHLLVAAKQSSNAAGFARRTYQKGRGDLRDVLDAEQVRLSAAQQLVQSEMTILLNLVDIYRNLGGGWDMASISQ